MLTLELTTTDMYLEGQLTKALIKAHVYQSNAHQKTQIEIFFIIKMFYRDRASLNKIHKDITLKLFYELGATPPASSTVFT